MGNWAYLIVILIGYLLGTSNMAVYLAAAKGVDLRAGGSGNPGASNAMILMGWRAGVIVGLHDIGKAVAAVLLAKTLFPALAFGGVVTGVACVLGHMFPFYMKFRGGKGFAAYLGMTIALEWKFALVLLAVVALVTLLTDYIVVGTMATVISFPVYCAVTHSVIAAAVLCVASGMIIYKHRANLVRIARGTEIGLRSANRGEHRSDRK
jgi:glycerol-3-phosphate acyltransferase PlsY